MNITNPEQQNIFLFNITDDPYEHNDLSKVSYRESHFIYYLKEIPCHKMKDNYIPWILWLAELFSVALHHTDAIIMYNIRT